MNKGTKILQILVGYVVAMLAVTVILTLLTVAIMIVF